MHEMSYSSLNKITGIFSFWQDLDRIVAENGGIKEKEPFSLSSTSYEEVLLQST